MENNTNENNNKKEPAPKIFIILRIIALCIIAVGVVLIISGISYTVPSSDSGVSMEDPNWFASQQAAQRAAYDAEVTKNMLTFGGVGCLLFSGMFLLISFSPSVAKIGIKLNKHIAEENKDDLISLANTGADIASPAVKKLAKSVKEGLSEDEAEPTNSIVDKYRKKSAGTKFCTSCGQELNADAQFCSACGKKQ